MGLGEDCGVDGSPGGVDCRPFGMDQPLFTSFVRKDCRFHPKNLYKPNKPTLLAQKVRGHVETTHWSPHGDLRVPAAHRQRYVPPAPFSQRGLC